MCGFLFLPPLFYVYIENRRCAQEKKHTYIHIHSMSLTQYLPSGQSETTLRVLLILAGFAEILLFIALIVLQISAKDSHSPGFYIIALQVLHIFSWVWTLSVGFGVMRMPNAYYLENYIYWVVLWLDVAASTWRSLVPAQSGGSLLVWITWLLTVISGAIFVVVLLGGAIFARVYARQSDRMKRTLRSHMLYELQQRVSRVMYRARAFLFQTWVLAVLVAIGIFVLTLLGLNVNDLYFALVAFYLGEGFTWLLTHAAAGVDRITPSNATVSVNFLLGHSIWRTFTTLLALVGTVWRIVITAEKGNTVSSFLLFFVWLQNTLGIVLVLLALSETIALFVLYNAASTHYHKVVRPLLNGIPQDMYLKAKND